MKKGISAKILLIPGFIIILFLLLLLFSSFDPQIFLGRFNGEYERNQAYLLTAMKTKLPEASLPEIKYPIQGYRIPGLGGFCWIESSSLLLRIR